MAPGLGKSLGLGLGRPLGRGERAPGRCVRAPQRRRECSEVNGVGQVPDSSLSLPACPRPLSLQPRRKWGKAHENTTLVPKTGWLHWAGVLTISAGSGIGVDVIFKAP